MTYKALSSAALALAAACSSAPRPGDGLSRCIWVDRWDWASAADIERVLGDCRAAGFTAVLFQVRGNGTVAFRSAREVWSERFQFQDPGFDPLAVAVAAAHARGMELHAWLNVVPGWVGEQPPAAQAQLWNSRRSWFLQDREGRTQPPAKGRYLALNPCLPEVRRYLAELCAEVARNYEVDGIHLDHIRFPDADGGSNDDLGVDAQTLALFTGTTGKTTSDLQALRRWQVGCVTRLVDEIAREVRSVPDRRPLLSAAVFADPVIALDKVRQDWPAWTRKGSVDLVLPMNYTADDAAFGARAREAVELAGRRKVVVGVGAYRHQSAEQTVGQLDAALAVGARGVGVFNYRTLFGKSAELTPDRQAELRAEVTAWLRGPER